MKLAPVPQDSERSVTVKERGRILWLDAAKGIGIFLVVVGHALGGLIDSPLGDGLGAFRAAFFAIYSFHMPLFFMLSGVLVAERLTRDRGGFARTLISNIVWPYFLWSAIQFTIIYQLGELVNQPVEHYWPTLLSLPWHSVSQFWFLQTLFILHGLSLLTWRRLGGVSFLLLGFALKPLAQVVPLPEMLRFAANQAPYYAIGVFLGAQGIAAVIADRPGWVRAALLLVAVALILATLIAAPGFDPAIGHDTARAAGIANLAWHYEAMPAALAGSFAVIGVASLCRGRIAEGLRFLGQRTMPIFILHILAIAGTRILLIRFAHVGDPWLILPLTITLGIVGPIAAYAALRRLGLAKPLGLG